jgi:hypothetical protein
MRAEIEGSMFAKRKREPGLRINNEPGLVIPIVVGPSRQEVVIRISRDANGCTIINAPKHVKIIKRDKRPVKSA